MTTVKLSDQRRSVRLNWTDLSYIWLMTPPSLNWMWLWLFFDFIVTDFVHFRILLVFVQCVTNRRWVWRFTRLVKTSFAWSWCINSVPLTSDRFWTEKYSLSVFMVHWTSCPFTRGEIRMLGTTMSGWAGRWRYWRVPCTSVSSIYSTPTSSATTTAVFAQSVFLLHWLQGLCMEVLAEFH